VKYVNLFEGNYLNEADLKFKFLDEGIIDLRGTYIKNDTAEPSPLLYQGGADIGIVGMLAQVGTHVSLINSQRSDLLSKEQEQANKLVAPLIAITNKLSLIEMLDDYSSVLVHSENSEADTVMIKPIFFSNNDMTSITLKSVIWLPTVGRRDNKVKYKNLIEIHSEKLSSSQLQLIVNGDGKLLSDILSSLIKMTMYIVKRELTGKYAEVEKKSETFLIKNGSVSKVVRGFKVDEVCQYQVIRDVHFWLVAYPEESTNQVQKC